MIRYTPHMTLLLLLLSAGGCSQPTLTPASEGQNPPPQTKQLKVVATFLPVYWFTKAVTGDKAQVEILVPPGAEVHEYQATPANVGAIATAGVLVKNGMGLEEFLEATVKNAGNSKLKEIDASIGIQAIEEISPVEKPVGNAGENPSKHAHEGRNPHVWLDPVLAKHQVENIRDGLIAADPENQATYKANAAGYLSN